MCTAEAAALPMLVASPKSAVHMIFYNDKDESCMVSGLVILLTERALKLLCLLGRAGVLHVPVEDTRSSPGA